MPLGEKLIGNGMLKKEQLDQALEEQKKSPGEKIGAILIRLGYVTKEQVAANL